MRIFLFTIILYVSSSVSAQKTAMETSGDILQFALPATALASTFIYPGDDKPHWQFLKSYAVTLITVHSLKRLIDKPRPNGGHYSFPSGHTASSFAGAAFLQRRYGWKIGIPAYLVASYVGYTRIKARKHDIYDVIGGASIAIASNLLFVKPNKNQSLSLQLLKVENYYLVGCSYHF